MFTKAIASMPKMAAKRGIRRLKKFRELHNDQSLRYLKLVTTDTGMTTVLIRHDTPSDMNHWLCGFFAAL